MMEENRSAKDCVDDENRNVARYAVKSTERLVRFSAEELNRARYVDSVSKKEGMLDYRNGKRKLSMANI